MTPTTGRAVTLDEIAVDAATQIRADDGRMTAGNAQALDVARLNDPLNLDRVPAAIRESTRAVVWHYEERDGKLTKVPDVPSDPFRRASVTDPSTWDSFSVARDAVEDGKADGAGFVLGDGWVGVDLDKCRDPETGIIEPSALAIIEKLHSYTEISPSGTGVHVYLNGQLPPGRRRKGVVEMYGEARYFTVTGAHLAATPTTIEHRTTELAAVHAEVFGTSNNGTRPAATTLSTIATLDDQQLLRIARRASNGSAFSRLWDGDLSGHASQSEADLGLCNHLAFYTEGDAAHVDRLFRQSGLMREKWDAPRGESTYGADTIARAIEGCRGGYAPGAASRRVRPALRVEVAEHPLTEAGTAERFARLHGGDVRYDHGRGRWLLWQGHRWAPDCDAAMTRLALDFARTWQRESVDLTDRDLRERTFRAAVRLERRDALMSMLKLAADLRPIADVGNGWDASPWLLGTPNGVVDLRTGQLRPGQRDDRLTSPRVLSISQRHGPNSGSRPSARSSWTSTPSTSSRSPWGTRRLGTRDETAGSSRRARVATARAPSTTRSGGR